jgi:hypothetical protein
MPTGTDPNARLHKSLDALRAQLDDLRVQAGLAKLEVRQRSEPIVNQLRDMVDDARIALDDLQHDLTIRLDSVRVALTAAFEDIEEGTREAVSSHPSGS